MYVISFLFDMVLFFVFFFFQAEDGIRDLTVTGVQTCALPICYSLCLMALPFLPAGRFLAAVPLMLAAGAAFAGFLVSLRALTADIADEIRLRSEERRVGEECRSRWWPDHLKKKKEVRLLVSRA